MIDPQATRDWPIAKTVLHTSIRLCREWGLTAGSRHGLGAPPSEPEVVPDVGVVSVSVDPWKGWLFLMDGS